MIERFKAWWRGERRVRTKAVRGRIYERKHGEESGITVKQEPKATVNPTRVYRSAEDKWYRYNPEDKTYASEE